MSYSLNGVIDAAVAAAAAARSGSGSNDGTSPSDAWNQWVDIVSNPGQFNTKDQDEGIALVDEISNIISSYKGLYSSTIALVQSIQRINTTFGDSMMKRLNSRSSIFDSIYRYYGTVRNKLKVFIEDLTTVRSRFIAEYNELEKFNHEVEDYAANPGKTKDITPDTSFMGKIEDITKIAMYGLIAIGVLKVIPYFIKKK